MDTSFILAIAQVIISVFLIVVILLQQRGTALGSAFGGGEGSTYTDRRGVEKTLFRTSAVLGILFIVLAIVQIIV